jgi:Fe-S-cluster-containing hydrogenase component 2
MEQRVRREIARCRTEAQNRTAAQLRQQSHEGLLSPQAAALGLHQGQRLMLIDLDRCTRCGECVKACAEDHPDQRARLHLIGPHFDRYLVPATCRSCLDPVCMVQCPVRAIHRGDQQEIVIENWCIECGRCANQCPYDAIQLHRDPNATDADKKGWPVVCDMCSASSSRGPACVYACPHEAAMRINARTEFPGT